MCRGDTLDGSPDVAEPAVPPALLHDVQAAVSAQLPAYIAELETLVNLDSGTYDRGDVTAVNSWLLRRLDSWKSSVVRNSSADYADSFSVTIGGEGTGNVMLLGHMDTVFPHGTTALRPFRIEGNYALGPGTCDMKAGLLAGIYAVEALQSVAWKGYHQLRLVVTSDEEVGAPSSRDFVLSMSHGMDAVFVLEAARENGNIVGQRRGGGFYQLEVHGRSAHAGVEPEKGRSAALSLCRQVVALHALTDLSLGQTVNVGMIQAGSRPNVVPDLAVAQVDLRADTQAGMEALLREVDTALAQSVLPGTTYQWAEVQFRPPWEPSDASRHLATLAGEVASTLGFHVSAAATGGTSDGNFTASIGIPTLDGLGPIGGLDHSPQEYIDISSIVPRTALLAGLITAVCSA